MIFPYQKRLVLLVQHGIMWKIKDSLPFQASVVFLLCRDDLDVEYFLQQLLMVATMQEAGTHPTTMILEWTNRHKPIDSAKIVEALCIAQCNHRLLKLGLDLDKLALYYFPKRPEISTHIHPILKLLYLMCERMTVQESSALLTRIRERHSAQLSTVEFRDPRMMEVHLLHLISCKILRVFDKEPQIGIVIDLLKEIDNLDLYDFLKSNQKQINCKEQQNIVVGDRDSGNRGLSLQLNSMATTSIPLENHEIYDINRSSPGILLIVNQFKFYSDPDPNLSYLLPSKHLDDRKGTEKDVDALQRTFQQFGFKIVIKNDLRHDEILGAIKQTIEAMKNSDSSFFVAILSHGMEGCVYGSNSIPLEVREIKNKMYSCGDHILLGRPKCLIVQACQGQVLQTSRQLPHNALETDSPTLSFSPVTIPPCSDTLIAWSTVEGFASLRHVLTGTWFIQTLCQTIGESFKT